MKVIVTFVFVLSLVAGLAGQATAASRKKHRPQIDPYGQSYRPVTRQSSSGANSDYYEHLLDKVPFGSRRWWSIYDEQHGTPN